VRFRAFIRNENTSQATWFVYVAQENGQTIYAARFNSAHNAQRIADRQRGESGHPPAARTLRQRMGFILARETNALVETNRERMSDHVEALEQTIAKLQIVLAEQRKVVEAAA